MHILHILFGDDYFIWIIRATPSHQGHDGVSKERLCVVLSHKERTICLQDPVRLYTSISEVMQHHVATSPSDYFIADHREVQLEAMRMAGVRGITYRPETCFALASLSRSWIP